ncbi:MAG: L-histidine N(alpha)-methyltransferase [candidate division Zixibacteria bacterium]|nr:L-histidine N(alpha)-methyltransferase [candidate division Zixibacteria bacterium]MDH3935914.1 L-histidine N(alpha)-methyltransferase [candidate division Zixibacteria bacterium]MDH4032819.1 L-histidine N(alpha)-methyltransferase [candidate division Zixibacteria bacterium]
MQQIHVLNRTDNGATFTDCEAFALDVLVGLSEARKSIPTIYHYDAEGSRLFDLITRLPEYYPTRCEHETLERNKAKIAGYAAATPFNLVEFGPGDGSKTRIIIEELLGRKAEFQYVPIDISKAALEGLLEDYRLRYPDLNINGLVCDYFEGITWLGNSSHRSNFVLFLGSNIGNFNHRDARFFLRNLWNCLSNNDHLLIGFDLKKDIDLLEKAYNDSEGVTAEFNINMLRRINTELGGQFDTSKFRHFGTYDVFTGAMESYLVSTVAQDVFIEMIGRSFHFDPWEPIHVEYSYKYHDADINGLAADTGFSVVEHLFDGKRYFTDSVWQVNKVEVDSTESKQ